MFKQKNGYIQAHVYGQSMFPTLRHKDTILIKKIPLDEIKKRDILSYKHNHMYIAHRVIKIINSGPEKIFFTKGDFNSTRERISGDCILGKVIGVYRCNKLTDLTFKSTFSYYWMITSFSYIKAFLMKIAEIIYSIRFARRVCKLFPLKADYFLITDTKDHDDFKSFYNFYPFSDDEYSPFCGFIAKIRNIPIAKLWVMKDKTGKFILYGLYVKILYRARNIGTYLVKEALSVISDQEGVRDAYAYANGRKTLRFFFQRLGFLKEEGESKGVILKRSLAP